MLYWHHAPQRTDCIIQPWVIFIRMTIDFPVWMEDLQGSHKTLILWTLCFQWQAPVSTAGARQGAECPWHQAYAWAPLKLLVSLASISSL